MSNDLLTEKVLRLVECIPSGGAASYGQLAAIAHTGPRQVGAIMARDGASVPWWRVVNARGRLPASLTARALASWLVEGTPLSPGGDGVNLRLAGIDDGELRALYEEATADLPR